MSLLDVARADAYNITTAAGGFGQALLFTAPNGVAYGVTGLIKKHHLSYDEQGAVVSSRTASVSVSEFALSQVLYPVRNSGGEVAMTGHKVAFVDSTGSSNTYVIRETYPDETVGLIVCILGEYE